ncbi:translation elongation factor 1-beta, putative [Trypanosoma equiperdum]|uniref:Translation elongation factor 1-beta, putative n=4 Tax=Trypanozoon TaxID=39700 RepID=Q38B20_TRYB2|nr:translation elongation factor 1-beta, putative [Trypanosoma brucei gambiense DAL972]XP_822828.1 translation elongation factor 1-beta, putative [Trypanosoma brucei brucei TREU927]RHW69493.1 translation elongation factor 1-beta [Trypanosoma brucei equiperdum]SCU68398.1 translation elongation factor 1-beta, putative [Trypanosoma equiperdum]EAN78000.1 translation elongation factor 1-beta, putative [Trypanosoma brucei brucei TREU927]CBH15623.1 translation elongation factor 1-beta, putative [Tryp|eukprot:XP_011777887.1 translation elongation factor 1-beta, putative [Trypanosoma brucei gambiense DAL972]
MSSLKEINGRLSAQPYVSGFTPSKEDARIFSEMFGSNTAVIQWAARMAAYYQAERVQLTKGATASKTSATTKAAAGDDDDIDLFGEATEEELAALEAKKKKDAAAKSSKKVIIAKSSILFDIKPWDDTVDLDGLAQKLHAIKRDGLLWGDHKLVPIAFGVKKLQQLVVIEDDKVSGDDLEEMIMSFGDDVQSMDIVAWNKI